MAQGLTTTEVAALRRTHGINTLPRPTPPGIALIFARQFLNPLIYILLVAAGVSLFFGHNGDAIFIGCVLLINALIGTGQEYTAQKAAAALENLVPAWTTVIRDGKRQQILAEALVPGDTVLVASGDKVPADLVLTQTENLSIDESLLTGESGAVVKETYQDATESHPLQDSLKHLFAGTIVNRGRGTAQVVATGTHTELGKIAETLFKKKRVKAPFSYALSNFRIVFPTLC